MTKTKYQQCRLRRFCSDGSYQETVLYFPENNKFKVGSKVRYKNRRDEEWSQGWTIISVGDPIEKDSFEEIRNIGNDVIYF